MIRIQKLMAYGVCLIVAGVFLSSCSYRLVKGANGRNHFSSASVQIAPVEVPLIAEDITEQEDEKPSASLATASDYRSAPGLAIALSGDDNLAK